MPRLLVRVLAALLALALVGCVFGLLAAFSLGFSQEAPLPREAATGLLVWSGFGAVVCGAMLWGLNHLARAAGRASARR